MLERHHCLNGYQFEHSFALSFLGIGMKTISWGAPKSVQMMSVAMKLKELTPWKKSYDQPTQHIKKQRHYCAKKGPSFEAMVFPVVMYGSESWTIKKAECRRIDALNCGVGEDL